MKGTAAVAAAIKDTGAMIRGMEPRLDDERFYFCTVSDTALAARVVSSALASFREAEGMSFILPEASARDAGLANDMPMRRITLEVHSALDGVGLTAAVAGALAAEDIPCNMVAAYHHDHVFVPHEMAERALAVLRALANGQ